MPISFLRRPPAIILASVCIATAAMSALGQQDAKAPSAPDAPKVGDRAPELGLESLYRAPDGQKTTWAELKGKTVVIEFWATWCKPCVAAFPHLNEIADAVADRDDIVMIAVTAEGWDIVEPFLKDKPLHTWIGIDSDRSASKAYGVTGIPRTVVVGPDGTIAADLYPTMLTAEMLEMIAEGKSLRPADGGGMPAGPGGMPAIPDSLAELDQMRSRDTEPGPAGKVLARLGGEWTGTASVFPMGPMGDDLSEAVTHSVSVAGGGRYAVERIVRPDGRAASVHVFGYDVQEAAYYLHLFSPRETAPTIWTGEWDEATQTLTFLRTLEVMMGGPDGGGDTIELDIEYAIQFKNESEIVVSQTLFPPAMDGAYMDPPPQLMAETKIRKRIDDNR